MGDTNCVTISRYCEISDPPCEGDLDMRLCQVRILYNGINSYDNNYFDLFW